jgi:hypothetical protein
VSFAFVFLKKSQSRTYYLAGSAITARGKRCRYKTVQFRCERNVSCLPGGHGENTVIWGLCVKRCHTLFVPSRAAFVHSSRRGSFVRLRIYASTDTRHRAIFPLGKDVEAHSHAGRDRRNHSKHPQVSEAAAGSTCGRCRALARSGLFGSCWRDMKIFRTGRLSADGAG